MRTLNAGLFKPADKFLAVNASLPEGRVDLSPADIEALDAKWAHAWTPRQAAQRLDGVTAPWYVAAGWALDLFRGRQTRRHGDLEVAVPASGFGEIRERFPASEYVFDAVGDRCLWPDAAPEALAVTHQTWLREAVGGDYLVDVFREPHEGQTWICRHDPAIRLPYTEVIRHTADGIPYLAPELVLLFKAKHARPKDQSDFEAAVPELSRPQRARLAELIGHTYPDHRWLEEL